MECEPAKNGPCQLKKYPALTYPVATVLINFLIFHLHLPLSHLCKCGALGNKTLKEDGTDNGKRCSVVTIGKHSRGQLFMDDSISNRTDIFDTALLSHWIKYTGHVPSNSKPATHLHSFSCVMSFSSHTGSLLYMHDPSQSSGFRSSGEHSPSCP